MEFGEGRGFMSLEGRLTYTGQQYVSLSKRLDCLEVRASSSHSLFDTQIQGRVSGIQDDLYLAIMMVTKFRSLAA